MKNLTKTIAMTLVVIGANATTVTTASAKEGFGLSSFERSALRMSYATDRNHDGRVTAEEVLLTVPEAFDQNGDGRLDARERGVALQHLRRHRFN